MRIPQDSAVCLAMFDAAIHNISYAMTCKGIIWPKATTHIRRLRLATYGRPSTIQLRASGDDELSM